MCLFFFFLSIFGRIIGRWRCRFSPRCTGICLVRWESNFNTSAIGSLNSDGSLDHGLFQISDLFWCDHQQGMDSACGLTCESIIIYSLTNSFKLKTFQQFSVGIIYLRSKKRGYQRWRHLRQANLPPTPTPDWKRFQRMVRITYNAALININD